MGDLINTVAILSACIVFLAKVVVDAYAKRKNGGMPPCRASCKAEQMVTFVSDLHRWHKPVTDPATGQPRFMWYENSVGLREELKKNRESTDELKLAIEKMNTHICALVEQIQKCPGPKTEV